MKKTKIIIISCLIASVVLFLVFTMLIKTVNAFKFVSSALLLCCGGLGVTLFSFSIINQKKLAEEQFPVYLTELYNAGVISQEQLLKPGKIEKEMFYSDYNVGIKKRILILVVVAFICVNFAVAVCFL